MSRMSPRRVLSFFVTLTLITLAAIAVNANWGSGYGFGLFGAKAAASVTKEIAGDHVPDGLSASDWDGIRAAHEASRSSSIVSIGQEAYLKPAAVGTTQANDQFGISVAVSGDTVVVGAWLEASSTTGVNSTPNELGGFGTGAAYVFTRSSGVWSQQAYLKPAAVGTTQAGDNFGWSVAISGDTVVVGAYREDSITTGVNSTPNEISIDSGAAYVFTRSSGVWTQQAYLKPAAVGTTQANDQFGISVAVSGDTVVVGARFEDSNTTGVNSTPNEVDGSAGAAYVFTRSAGVWTQQAFLKPAAVGTSQAGDLFGNSVAISDDTVVVGAYQEDSSTTGVNSTPNESSSGSGAAYVFTRSSGVWTQEAYLKPAAVGTTQVNDQFGYSMAVAGDTVVVGAAGEDSSTLGVNSTPNESAINAGAAYVFTRSSGVWTQQAYLKPAAVGTTQTGDQFGWSVAVAGDTVAVGTYFEDSSTTGVNSTPNDTGGFNFNSGAAYVFTRSAGLWTQQAYLKPSAVGTTQADDRFGTSVAVAGDTVVVGAISEDSNTTGVNSTPNESSADSGAAYTFAGLGPTTPTATNTSTPTDTPTDTPTATATNTPTPPVCPAGSYFNGSACVLADPGFYVPTAGATSQTACAEGTYQPNSGATSCLNADAGSFVANPGSQAQTPCAAGTYQPNSGAASCLSAAAGSFVANPGSAAQTPCAAGTYQPNSGAASCLNADAGSFVANPGSAAQTACAAGTYQPNAGSITCLNADAGSFVANPGSAAQTPCAAGTYQPNSGSISCLSAAAGSFVANPGSAAQTPCAAGSYQPNSGAISCLNADAGSFVANPGSLAQTPCLAGTFQPNSGAQSCLNADAGSFVANPGSAAQTACAAGSYQPSSGASACLLADPGFYVPTSGATAQTPCAPGTTSGPGATVCTAVTATATNTPTPTPEAVVSGTVAYGNAIGAPSVRGVPNVLVSAAGSPPLSDTTVAAGTYSLTGFGTGSYTITPSKSGGQNGSITAFDAGRIAQYLTGNTSFTAAQATVADVSGAGGISSYDAALIGRYAAALGSPTGSSGSWIFSPASNIHPSVTMDVTEDYAALLIGDTSGNWGDPSPFRPAFGTSLERSAMVIMPSWQTDAGKETIIPINVKGAAGKDIIAYEFDLRYDPAVIQPMKQPVDVTGTVSRGFTVVTNASEPGLLRVVVYGAFPLDENGVLLNLRFTAVGKAGSVSPLTFERIMFNEGEPRVTFTEGLITLF